MPTMTPAAAIEILRKMRTAHDRALAANRRSELAMIAARDANGDASKAWDEFNKWQKILIENTEPSH